MRKMKESGIAWIGQIPEKWNITKLKYLFSESIAGEVIDKSYWNDGNEILYTCQKTPMYSNYPNFPERKRTRNNDLLLTRNATPYIFIPEQNSIYSNVVQKITLNSNLSKKYVKYALLSGVNSLQVNGDTIPSWNMEVWSNISIPIMNIKYQDKIVEFLDKKIAEIDTVIDKTKETIEDYKKYKNNFIIKVTTKGLDKNAKMKDTDSGWIGKIPEHWDFVRINTLFHTVDERNEDENAMLLSLYTSIGVKPRSELEEKGNKAVTVLNYKKVKENDIIVNKLLAWMGAIAYSDYEGVTR